jgi:D-sedoheptulose 7-phosphate isomerase
LAVKTAATRHSLAALKDAREALDRLIATPAVAEQVDAVADRLAECLRAGGKVLACGNGGSACDAAHFVEELTGRFRRDRPPLPAIACTDAGHITCTANDYGYERVFSRWVEALGREGDALVLLSTSGESENILRAAEAGAARDMTVVALLGRDGGRAIRSGAIDHPILVPGDTADRIQELHMLILHALVEGVERLLFPPA